MGGSIYNIQIAFFLIVLSVEKEFAKSYEDSNGNIGDFVRSVTRGVDKIQHKTSSTKSWSAASVCRHVLNVLFLPVKLLGMLILILHYIYIYHLYIIFSDLNYKKMSLFIYIK
jgi:hypothetical protein